MLEDMYWIDAATGKAVASVLDAQTEGKIVYGDSLKKVLQGKTGLIAMHTHPQSMPPSIADFNSSLKNGYGKSIIICHDGIVYEYISRQEVPRGLYERYIGNYLKEGYSEKDAQLKALKELKKNFNIDFGGQ